MGGYDFNSLTGPQDPATGDSFTPAGIAIPLPGAATPTNEKPFLIRSSLDTDLIAAYGRNPAIMQNTLAPNTNVVYPGATFHKPIVGGDQPSTLTVPDDPEKLRSRRVS